MKLDHFVVHIDSDEDFLTALKSKIEPLGFPFEPFWGKGTKGFKASNIWIGRQYFEIIRILKKDGGGWVPNWVKRHQNGVRGLYCIFLLCDDIETLAASLKNQGVLTDGPERITFKAFFGLFKKTLPWRLVYIPEIPGTNLEIGFIQYDPDPNDSIKQYLVPNSDEFGIEGISSATVRLPLIQEVKDYLQKIFSNIESNGEALNVPLSKGFLKFVVGETVEVVFDAETSNPTRKGKSFSILNTTVRT